jgi:ArsR family transcriptional regulator, arsenate/arsenite/antimonite-responsive transcriptional repressor
VTTTAACSPAQCPPAKARKGVAVLSDAETDDLAAMLKALGHPARLKLVKYLADYGTCYFGDLSDVLPLAPSTISQHVTILKEAGLIEGSSEVRRVCYCVKPGRLELLKRLLGRI